MLVAFDAQYRLADFYYPHVGMDNHAAGRFRFGVWADVHGTMAALGHPFRPRNGMAPLRFGMAAFVVTAPTEREAADLL